jgi:iron complex outermembrane receptor protein
MRTGGKRVRAVTGIDMTNGSGAARWLLAGASAVTILCATAQVAHAQGTEAVQPADAGQIEEIIVTARKREEAAQDVPVSVSTFDAEGFAAIAAGGADISVLSARTPSVVVESSFGRTFPRFYIRGLGNTDFDLNASQPVSLVYDNVVYENPVLKGFPVFDIASVEVLRGPQGTLFGRNTPAGVIKFDSVLPDQDFDAFVRVGARSLRGAELEAAVGGGLTDTLSFRVAGLIQTQGDWVSNSRTPGAGDTLGDYRDQAARAQLRWRPTPAIDAVLQVNGRNLMATSQLFRANIIRPGTGGLVAGFDREQVSYDGGDGNNQRLQTWGVTGTVRADIGEALTLVSVTGLQNVRFFGRGDIDGGFGASFAPPFGPGFIPFPAETADAIDDLQQFTQEVRLESAGGGLLDWTVGAYLFREEVEISTFNFDTLARGRLNGFAGQTQETDAWAVFGSVDVRPTEALTLTAGLRWSDDSKDFVGRRFLSPFGAPALGPVRVGVGDSALSGDVSAVLELNDDVNVYARYARGFRAPSIQGRILFGDAVTTADSETVDSIEGGVKSFLADRSVRLDVSGFWYRIQDQQLTAIGGAGNFNQLINAEEGTGYGLEAEGEWFVTDSLALNGSVSWNRTEIQDPGLAVAACGAPFLLCTVTDPLVAGGLAVIDGNSFPNAPEWIANVGARYERPFIGGRMTASTDWSYKGETNFFLYESREFREDGFWEGGVRLSLADLDGTREIAVYGRNITDETRLVGGIDFNNLTGFINNPRIWGVEVILRR